MIAEKVPRTTPALSTQAAPTALRSLPRDSTEPPAARRGRPSAYTPENIERICWFIRQEGVSNSAAAESAGFTAATISRWLRDHEELDIILNQARGQFRSEKLDILKLESTSGRPNCWRAAAWLLERAFPEDYSLRYIHRRLAQEEEAAKAAAAAGENDITSDSELHNLQNSASEPPSPVTPESSARSSSECDAPARDAASSTDETSSSPHEVMLRPASSESVALPTASPQSPQVAPRTDLHNLQNSRATPPPAGAVRAPHVATPAVPHAAPSPVPQSRKSEECDRELPTSPVAPFQYPGFSPRLPGETRQAYARRARMERAEAMRPTAAP